MAEDSPFSVPNLQADPSGLVPVHLNKSQYHDKIDFFHNLILKL